MLNRLHPRPHSRRPAERKFKLFLARLIELAPLHLLVCSPHVALCDLPFSDGLLEILEHYFKFTTYSLCGFVYVCVCVCVCVQKVYSHELLDVCANMILCEHVLSLVVPHKAQDPLENQGCASKTPGHQTGHVANSS